MYGLAILIKMHLKIWFNQKRGKEVKTYFEVYKTKIIDNQLFIYFETDKSKTQIDLENVNQINQYK